MKTKTWLAAYLAAMVLLTASGCSHSPSSKLTNEIALSLDGISDIIISYDEEQVTFCQGEGNTLIIKEYMTEMKRSYCARVTQDAGKIKISEGGKPFFKDRFSRYIEVYLPASYHQKLTVTTTDGSVDASAVPLSLQSLRMDSTAGVIRLGDVEAQSIHLSTTSGRLDTDHLDADAIQIDTTSGDFACGQLEGYVTYTTTSGSASIQSAAGSGSFKANQSGELRAVFTEVTGDLSFFNKNGSIYVTLPAGLEFLFEATTKNGSVSTNFYECLSVAGRTTSGAVGSRPSVTITAETNNGTIDVRQ